MSDFVFEADIPAPTYTQNNNSNSGGGSNIDYKALNEYQLSVLGEGKQPLIGTIVAAYELGVQPREEQAVPWDAQAKASHGWRLETYEDSGTPKCPGARLETQMRKGQSVEVLVFPQDPVPQMTLAVDFPEKMMNLDQFYAPDKPAMERPFREILGLEGFGGFKKVDGKNTRVVARPINLRHVDVNRTKKDNSPKHLAFATNSMIYKLADFCGVLDENKNFHIHEVGKLIGKSCMFDVEASPNHYTTKGGDAGFSVRIYANPSSRMSDRDRSFYDNELASKIDQGSLGIVQLKGASSDQVFKETRKVIWDTLSFASNYEGSPLAVARAKEQAEYLANRDNGSSGGGGNSGSNTNSIDPTSGQDKPKGVVQGSVSGTVNTPVKEENTPPLESNNQNIDNFDDDIPF